MGLPGNIRGILTEYFRRAHLRLGYWPEWLAHAQSDWPPIERTGFVYHEPDKGFSPDLAAFIAQGEPFVVFTAGTGNDFMKSFFQSALEAVRQGSHRAIFAGSADQMPKDLPPSVLHIDWAPFSELFPHAAAVVPFR